MPKKHIKTIVCLFSAVFFVFSSIAAFAETPTSQGDYGLSETVGVETKAADGSSYKAEQALLSPTTNTPQALVGRIIGTVLSFVGVIFFVLIFYSGLRWMMAQGNESTIDSAKQTIIAAIFGLVIVLAAYAITSFIGTQLTN
jgi:cbb3-type cytochrome oxidase subunit 3